MEMNTKRCPKCKRKGVDLFLGFTTGNYLCKKCGYIGPIVIEESTIITKKTTKKPVTKTEKKTKKKKKGKK